MEPRIKRKVLEEVFREKRDDNGKLISIIGFDGSGKTTIVSALANYFRERNFSVVETRQPTDWYREQVIVEHFHDNGGSVQDAKILSLIAAADRHKHIKEVVDPALKDGKIVICDRYVYATYGVFIHRGIDAEFLTVINKGVPRPDYAFYLKMTTDDLIDRLKKRDGNDLKFEERSRDRIDSIIRTYEEMGSHLIQINSNQEAEKTLKDILEYISI